MNTTNKFKGSPGFLSWIIVLLLTTLTAACGGGGGKDPILGIGGGVTVIPTVTATAPLATTPSVTGVATNSKITATFSKDMQSSTITDPATFTIACPSGTAATGTVSYLATSRVATFTPSPALPINTVCTATISTGAQDLTGVALANAFVWQFKTSATTDTTRPTVTNTVPADAASPVATNTKITAQFSEDMDPATISGTSFTLTSPGPVAVAGTVSYSVGARTATFTPSANLAASTTFTATVTTAAMDLAGNSLLVNKVWTFTTGTLADATVPTVTLVSPVDRANNVAINSVASATFSKAMDASTITTASFTVQVYGPPLGAALVGTVAYDVQNHIATFTPKNNLAANTEYKATVTTQTKDLAGNALAVNKVWTFTTSVTSATSPAVDLGSAAAFGAMGGTAGVTSCGPTLINGNVSTTAVPTAITGLIDGNGTGNNYTATGSCIGTVNGEIFTNQPLPGTAASYAIAQKAALDAQSAFDATSRASMPGGITQNPELGGLTLAPGIYWSASPMAITSVDLTLDAQGDANAVWVFQSDAALTVGVGRKIILTNGAQAKNVYWHLESAATINSGVEMKGTLLTYSGVTMGTGATLDGRAISMIASVTMLSNIINVPAP